MSNDSSPNGELSTTYVEETAESNTTSKTDFKAQIGQFAYLQSLDCKSTVSAFSPSTAASMTPPSHKRRASSTTSPASRLRREIPPTDGSSGMAETSSQASQAREARSRVTSTTPRKRTLGGKSLSTDKLYSPPNKLVDSLRPGLMLIMVGLNPGLTTAETGHAYAHRSNLFWKLMHGSGITPIKHEPADTRSLMDLYSIGNTNLCVRPTLDQAGLVKQEMVAGVPILEEKVRALRPEVVCIVGKGIWDTIHQVKTGKVQKKGAKNEFTYGWQDENLWIGREVDDAGKLVRQGARTFVATTTSGLAAGMKPAEKLAVWRVLGDWIRARRTELNKGPDDLPGS